MTITISRDLFYALGGAAACGVFMFVGYIVLAAFGRLHSPAWMTPSRAAGWRRFGKMILAPVAGVVLTNAAAWLVLFLVHLKVDSSVANAAGLVVGAALGGAHQSMTWANPAPTQEVPTT